jgi:hypothetical protein
MIWQRSAYELEFAIGENSMKFESWGAPAIGVGHRASSASAAI